MQPASRSTRAHPSMELGAEGGAIRCCTVHDRPNRLRCHHACVQWQPEQRHACAVVCTACPGVSDVPRLTLWRVLAYASTSHLPGEGVDRGQPTRLDSVTACSRGAFNNDALPRANVETRAGALVAGALPCSSQSSNRRRSKGGREAAPRVAVLTMTQMTQRQKPI